MVHEPAPLVNLALQISDQLIDLVARFPRNLQHSLGRKIVDGGLELLIHLSAATSRIEIEDKQQRLSSARQELGALMLLLRLSYHRKLLSEGSYAKTCVVMVEAESQMDAYRTWLQRQCQP